MATASWGGQPYCASNDPIALWQMVGLTDNTCPMNLATPIRDRFVTNNGCTQQTRRSRPHRHHS
jgi:hypothetical protein